MSSTNKTSLGLNMWEASDKPVRQDFVNDNVIINKKISELNNEKANKTDLWALTKADSVLGMLRYLPIANIDNPNAFLGISSWGNCSYMSYGRVTPTAEYGLVFGVYDHNNGTPKGQQLAVVSGSLASREYRAGAWTAWSYK